MRRPSILIGIVIVGITLVFLRQALEPASAQALKATDTTTAAAASPAATRQVMVPVPVPVAAAPAPAEAPASEASEAERPPLARALGAEYKSVDDKNVAISSALRASGPSDAAFTRRTGAAAAEWQKRLARQQVQGDLVRSECYAAGCLLEMRYTDAHAYELGRRAANEAHASGAWPGGGTIVTSGGQDAAGSFVHYWILLPPEPETAAVAQ